MARYAETTEVSADRSLGQIQALLKQHGASAFSYGEDNAKFGVGFVMEGRSYRFIVPLPQPNDPEIRFTDTGKERAAGTVQTLLGQGRRQRFRALLLVLKAKLEAVEIGITTLEEEFLPALVLANGETVGQWAKAEIIDRYALREMPRLMALGPGAD